MTLTNKEKELLDELAAKGQVVVADKKDLEKVVKKLEEVFGKSDLKYENNAA